MTDKPLDLKPADQVEILTLVDNYTDLLIPNDERVTRPPLTYGEPVLPTDTLLAEQGLSLLVTVRRGQEEHVIMLDAGYSQVALTHNMDLLGIDAAGIEAIVISHGHMDHTGSLPAILERIGRPVPVVVHPEAFFSPRYFYLPDGGRYSFPLTLDRQELERLGAELIVSADPSLLADETILVTGQVPRVTPFEQAMPNTMLERDGQLERDLIIDDQAIVIHLKGQGLLVISGCAHSGIINTILYAQEITGQSEIYLAMGGFHLTRADPEKVIEPTVAEMERFSPRMVVPMHCTGWAAINRFAEAFPSAFALNTVGARIKLPLPPS